MRRFFILMSGLIISACGGSSSDNNSTSATTTPPGIYSGSVTLDGGRTDSAVAIITTDNHISIVDTDSFEAFIGTIINTSASGTLYSSDAVPATGEITTIASDKIEGTYTSSLGGGSFSLDADSSLYSRVSSLAKLEGVWVDSAFITITGTSTWVIQSDGSVSMTSTSGCAATGHLSVIDETKNEYNLALNVTNCPPYDENGSYTGQGYLTDTLGNQDNTLPLIVTNGIYATVFKPIK